MFIVIMAGGSGTRFWPYSRKAKPKQFLNIIGDRPMVVETWERVKSLAGKEQKGLIVLGEEHLQEAEPLFARENIDLLAEPVGRNTAPCICLAALYAQHLGISAPLAILPADHYISDVQSFTKSLQMAATLATSGAILTLGIVPTRPETGYGYIKKGSFYRTSTGEPVFEVSAFVEKPDLKTAKMYLGSGKYLWNAGIFVATAETILKEMEKYLPDLFSRLEELRPTLGKPEFDALIKRVYPQLPNISFDYGIMEKTEEKILTIPTDCGWSDVGSWYSLYELKKSSCDAQKNLVEDDTLLVDCEENFVSNKAGRFIACLGLRNCLIVDTPDALLVAKKDRSQDVRKIVEYLKKRNKEELL